MKKLALALLATVCALPISSTKAQEPLPPTPRKVPLELGAAWYPEQWPESRWDADLALMERPTSTSSASASSPGPPWSPPKATTISTGSTAPSALAEKHHIAVVIGTPTAAPPAWLTTKYPETLRINEDGRQDQHGNRQQFNWSDPKYRELCRIIATKLAKRFGHDPNVIGWQIDNEYAAESFGPDDPRTIPAVAQGPSTRPSTTSTRTGPPPTGARPTTTGPRSPSRSTYGNPGLLLDWKRFVSDTWRSYQRNQIDAIRAHADQRQFITTNMMGWFDGYDHYTVAQDLDLASWDDYVGTGQLNAVSQRRPPRPHPRLPPQKLLGHGDPARLRQLVARQQLPRQRRSPRHGLAGHRPRLRSRRILAVALRPQRPGAVPRRPRRRRRQPVPLYAEVAQLGDEFDKAGPALAGTTVHSDVAILHDYPSPLGHRLAAPQQGLRSHPRLHDLLLRRSSTPSPLRRHHQPDTVRSISTSSSSPPPSTSSPRSQAKNLIAYVHSGGHLVLGPALRHEGRGQRPLAPSASPARSSRSSAAASNSSTRSTPPSPSRGDWGSGTTTLWAEQLSTSQPRHQSPHALRQDPTAGSTTSPPPSPAKSARAASPTSAPRSIPLP